MDENEDEISSDEETTKNNKKAKKAKPQKTKKQLQKTLVSESEPSEIESETDEEIHCSKSEDSNNDNKNPKKKKDAWKKECFMNLALIRFLPMDYIHVIIPATNQSGSRRQSFKDSSIEELMKCFGLIYATDIVKISNRHMYWDTSLSDSSLLPNTNFSKYISRHRFEEILSFLQFSFDPDKDKQIMEFFLAVNDNLLEALTTGNITTYQK